MVGNILRLFPLPFDRLWQIIKDLLKLPGFDAVPDLRCFTLRFASFLWCCLSLRFSSGALEKRCIHFLFSSGALANHRIRLLCSGALQHRCVFCVCSGSLPHPLRFRFLRLVLLLPVLLLVLLLTLLLLVVVLLLLLFLLVLLLLLFVVVLPFLRCPRILTRLVLNSYCILKKAEQKTTYIRIL